MPDTISTTENAMSKLAGERQLRLRETMRELDTPVMLVVDAQLFRPWRRLRRITYKAGFT